MPIPPNFGRTSQATKSWSYKIPKAAVIHPVRKALRIEDIVSEICRWLGPLELARLLRTAKLFVSAARRELWRNHATLEGLLFALPSSIIGRKRPFADIVGRF